MPKETIKIGVRIVQRPAPIKPAQGEAYRPPKSPVFKAIATCDIAGKHLSKTASKPTEQEARLEAYSKLATLVAKQGALPAKGYGVDA